MSQIERKAIPPRTKITINKSRKPPSFAMPNAHHHQIETLTSCQMSIRVT